MSTRTLPIRVSPLPGEAIDSWLEALAARYSACWSDILEAVGLSQPPTPVSSWIAGPTPHEIAALIAATAEDPGVVEAATLARYDAAALRIDPVTRTLDKTFPWSPATSSRFCPQCLAETGGRWQLAWRLGWSFACLRHHRLLAGTCPVCRQRQRRRPSIGIVVPAPGRCASPLPGSVGRRPTRCGADLSETETLLLGGGHPALDAQQTICDIIDAGVAPFGVYARSPQPAEAALTDVRVVANRVLSYATTMSLAGVIPGDLLGSCPEIGARARSCKPSPTAVAPATAVAAATAVTAAVTALGAADAHQGGEVLRWLVIGARDHGVKINASTMGRSPASPVLDAVQLAALAPSMSLSDQLRYRITDALPRRPEPGTLRVGKLTRSLPAMLWPAWSLRLTVPGPQQRQLRPAISAMLMITGTLLPIDEAVGILGGVLADNSQVTRMLSLLFHSGDWKVVRQALTLMADHLVEIGSPIDYERRRRLDYTDLLPDETWQRICREAGTPAISRTDAASKARCFLFERLSGLPLDSSPAAVNDDRHFRHRTADFVRNLTPELAHALENHSREFLATHDIRDEPSSWQPPTNLLEGLPLPGGDPADIDIDKLHQLIRHEDHTLSEAAEALSTTRDTIRYLLEVRPAPLAPQGDLRGTSYLAARAALPPDKLSDLYLRQRRSITDIAQQAGVRDRVIARLARDYQIPLREPGRQMTASIDRDWLHEQYVVLGRPLTTLAREVGTSWRTLANWAERHDIPLRRRDSV